MFAPPHPGMEAVGQTRLAIKRMRADYDRFFDAFKTIPPKVTLDYVSKGAVGRDRNRQRILDRVKRPPFLETERGLLWRLLYPRTDPLNPSSTRVGVEVIGAFIGASRGQPVIDAVPLGLWMSAHVLHRAHVRTMGKADLVQIALTTHDAILDMPADILGTVREYDGSWCFPCGEDAVVARIKVVRQQGRDGDCVLLASAGTFLNRDLMGADQEAQRAACLYPHAGPKMRDGLMLPSVFRAPALCVEGFVNLPTNAADFLRKPKSRAFPFK